MQNGSGTCRSRRNDLAVGCSICYYLLRAGNGTRTRDPNLGKVVLYQLSYSRVLTSISVASATDKRRRDSPHHGTTPSACTAYHSVWARRPATDASPPFACARPDSSTCSAANP